MTGELRADVVAGRYDATQFDSEGAELLVNEVFYSLQGEGENAGQAAVFVRMAKCNLACKFCDTEFATFTRRPVAELVEHIVGLVPAVPQAELANPDGGALEPEAELWVRAQLNPWVILTGGEPGLQNLLPLVKALHARGFKVALETSGSVWANWMAEVDHVCVSPKVPLKRVPESLRMVAAECKWIVNATFLAMYEADPAQCYMEGVRNFLQPESLNPKWTVAASKLVMANPGLYTLSLQTHKLAGNP